MRESLFKFLLTIGFVLCIAIVLAIGYHVYNIITSKVEPPKLVNFVPVPIQIGDKTVLIGVGIVNWQVPPELNAAYLQAELMNREAEAKKQADSNSAAGDANATNDSSITTPNQPTNPKK